MIEFGARGRTQTFNLWFVGPALYQLSYSGERWWSELESNQPFGLFRPALIRLSYPTRDIANCRFSIADWSDNESLSIGNWHSTIGNARQALRLCSLCTFSMTARSSCTSMK